ncbi:hypothetical protein ACVIHC_008976 [Bradyrhizobium diazoefficiens]
MGSRLRSKHEHCALHDPVNDQWLDPLLPQLLGQPLGQVFAQQAFATWKDL